jgi:phosphoglycerate dehydrogenase-like enzyme
MATGDVTDPEPLPADHKLFTLANVIVTCHTAANLDESDIDCQRHGAREVANVKAQCPRSNTRGSWKKRRMKDSGGMHLI